MAFSSPAASVTVLQQTVQIQGLPDTEDFIHVNFSDGEAVCECGVKGWCDHAAVAIGQGLDGEEMITLLRDEGALRNTVISVPVIPTHKLWVPVNGTPISDSYYSFELRATVGNDDPFLGVIRDGEGREALRLLIVAWLHSRTAEKTITCTSTSHGMKAMRAEMSSNVSWKFANLWSKYWTGWCLTCASMMNDDDLVPDIGAKRSPW